MVKGKLSEKAEKMKIGDRKTDRKKRQTGRIQWMKIYPAPLEGITGHIYRTALKECFDGFDKYFIPFISPNQKGISARGKRKMCCRKITVVFWQCRRF